MTNHYDVAVIGSGPGGYVSAIRCAQLGFKTVCIEEVSEENEISLGGTCLNVGCVPSKALLESSLAFSIAKNDLEDHGIKASGLSLDLEQMQRRKERVISSMTKGVSGLLKLNKVDTIEGRAYVQDRSTVKIKSVNKEIDLKVENIILATGSRPTELLNYQLDHEYFLSSSSALELNEVPTNIAVIGAGAVGLELASIWSRLGSKVTVCEVLTEFLPNADLSVSNEALKILKKQGLNIKLGIEIESLEIKGNKVEVRTNNEEVNGLKVDKVIFAIGRCPASEDLFDSNLGVKLDNKNFVEVNEFCQSNVPNIYAIGDLVRGPMLAHKASEEGLMVAEKIAGNNFEMNYRNIPSVIYTHPEIAWSGYSEELAIEEGFSIETGMFPFKANARALASNEEEGFVKVIVNKDNDLIIGVHALGPSAADVVQQGLIAMESNTTADQLGSIIFSHPTVSEALHEAVLSAKGKAVHLNNRKRK
tara:strand:- start:20992 stop:22419 length:1428 start_codon:yes stop_codon:yes gene_type:complete